MEDKILSCPLCCGKTFDSKQALVLHLANYAKNYQCPLCISNFSSVPLLLEHLSYTDCNAQENEIPIVSAIDSHSLTHNQNNETISKSEARSNNENLNQTDDDFHDDGAEDHDMSELPEESLEANKMYEELIQKYEDKQFPGADMQLLEENGHSRYTIVAHNGVPAIMSSGTVITKQNSDGTISITTAKDDKSNIMIGPTMKTEPEPVITVTEKDHEGDGDEGIYSCNMCGVSFFSVLEHIQNYHKDQDVVVEVNEQNGIEGNGQSIEFVTDEGATKEATDPDPFEFVSITQDTKISIQENLETGDVPTRRVITDTGDIVETSARNKTVVIEVPSPTIPTKNIPLASLEEDVVDKKGRVFRRKLVHLDKMNGADTEADSALKTPPKQPYHQVVVKEIVTMDGNKKMKVYNCIACHIYVTELEEFKSHPCKSLKYTCSHCPVSYENAKSLCAHMKVHKASKHHNIAKLSPTGSVSMKKEDSAETVAAVGPYKCDICSTVFPTNKSLKLHKRMHDPVKPRAIEPPIQEETEENPEKYLCTVCSKLIPIGYRDVHDNFHDSPENFNCEICNKKFESSNYLAMHMSVHNMDKAFSVKKQDKSLPYTCLYCNRQFARPHEKVKHERIHTGEKPHTCEICGKAFRVSYCLTLHMRTHTGARPYACHHCGKRFKAHSVYNHHLLTHSDVRAYKCPYCPKAFKTSVQLAGHKNSHTKPFACEHCNRPFASLYAVRVHQETHRRQNNLKFSCSLCGASYARSFALKDHVKQAHANEVENPDTFVININKETWEIGDGEQLDSKEKMDTEITTLEKSPNEETVMCVM